MRTAEMDELVELHKMATLERDKVWIEAKMWWLSTEEDRGGLDREGWLLGLLGSDNGNTRYAYQMRAILENVPAEIWTLAESRKLDFLSIKKIHDSCQRLQEQRKLSFEESFQEVVSKMKDPHAGRTQAVDFAARDAEISRLVVLHGKASTEREKTIIEGQVWALADKEERRTISRTAWLISQLGREKNSSHDYRKRGRLAKASPEVWEYAESNGLGLSAIAVLFDLSEDLRSKGKLSVKEAIRQAAVQMESSHKNLKFKVLDPSAREREIGRLVGLHKASSIQKEKADIEEQLWRLSSGEERRQAPNREAWLMFKLGGTAGDGSCTQYKERAKLREAPAEMWEYIEGGKVALGIAVRIYRDTLRIMKAEGVNFTKALEAASKPRASLRSGKVADVDGDSPRRGDWANLYSVLDDIAQARMRDLPEFDRRDLCEDLKRRIQAEVATFIAKVHRRKAGEDRITFPALYQKVKSACESLRMNPPSYREQVDLKAAKKNKLALVAFYHPDSNPSGSNTEDYQTVIEAYDTIELYNKRLGKSK